MGPRTPSTVRRRRGASRVAAVGRWVALVTVVLVTAGAILGVVLGIVTLPPTPNEVKSAVHTVMRHGPAPEHR